MKTTSLQDLLKMAHERDPLTEGLAQTDTTEEHNAMYLDKLDPNYRKHCIFLSALKQTDPKLYNRVVSGE